MAADDKTTATHASSQAQQSPDVLADKGRGNMVSENVAANDRFERNSTALQEQQQQPSQPSQQLLAKKELTFGPDRQAGRNLGQLKAEQAKATTPDQRQQSGKNELSFGPDRRRARSLDQLKAEQAKATGKDQGQQPGEKKGLSFGSGRGPGQAPGLGLGDGR
jgi:hypothetical protein